MLQLHPNDQGSLLANIGAAQASLRETVGAIRNGSQEALGAAAKLAAEAAHGVDGSRPQGEAATAMSSSVEQMARNVMQTADVACSVRQHGDEAEARAQQGGNEVRKLAERSAGSTREISAMIEAIGACSNEAAAGMQQSLLAVDQSVAQLAEEGRRSLGTIAGSAGRLEQLSRERDQVVGRFRLCVRGGAAPTLPAGYGPPGGSPEA